MPGELVAVALPLPLQTAFTYRVPEGLSAAIGARVLVPFGQRRVIGLVTGPGAETPGEVEIKDVVEVIDEGPLVSPPLLQLAAWVADHYLAPPGECYRLVLPLGGIRASRAMARITEGTTQDDDLTEAVGKKGVRVAALSRKMGESKVARLKREGVLEVEQDLSVPGFRETQVATLADTTVAAKGKAQAEVIDRLNAAGGTAKVADLVRDRPALRSAVKALADKGVLHLESRRDARMPEGLPAKPTSERTPTPDQAAVLTHLEGAVEAGVFAPFLLHGVTGSGKTEVYFRAAEAALARSRGVLILVPEIALTPLLVRAATARFGPTVTVLHSDLSAGERHDQWWRIREGEARVVVGARSAVFAPIADLGLIVVDEEHEASYKQEETPRYHGRDVAVMRGRLEAAVTVLGSATPSLESQANADAGRYQRLLLPKRIGSQGLPRINVVDRRIGLKAGDDPILTSPLIAAIEERLARKEQTLLLLNRRGYAVSFICRECAEPLACPNCSVSLAVHETGRAARCHYCSHHMKAPEACHACKGEYLRLAGYGTERVVEAVQAAVPKARVDRLDRDRAQRRGAVASVLSAFEDGEIDVLVGTQMIAKGHDFPRVTLVGVVDADVGLGLPDFRSAERTFHLLTQVAGRAGRADLPGEVILQTHLPNHYVVGMACDQDYAGFYAREMEFRRTMGYPPSGSLVNVVLHGRDAAEVGERAVRIGKSLRQWAQGRFRVLGPAPAPLARLRQEHRFQVLLKGPRAACREAVRRALVAEHGAVRWPGVVVDVDPVSVM